MKEISRGGGWHRAATSRSLLRSAVIAWHNMSGNLSADIIVLPPVLPHKVFARGPGFIFVLGVFCCLVALPASTFGRTIYVDKSSPCGDGCDGSDWSHAFHNIQDGIDTASAVGDEVLVAEGVYHEALVTKHPNITLRGEENITNTMGAIVDSKGLSRHTIIINHDGIGLKRLTFRSCDPGNYNLLISNAFTVIVDECIVTIGERALSIFNSSVILNRCLISNHKPLDANNDGLITIKGNQTNITFNYCIFMNNSDRVTILNEALVHFNNCLFTGFGSGVLALKSGAPSVYLNNSVLVSNAIGNNSSNILNNSSNGSLYLANCLVHPNPRNGNAHNWVNINDSGGNIGLDDQYSIPAFASPRKKAILILGLDDIPALTGRNSFYERFAKTCEKRGFRSSYSLNTERVSASDWNKLRAFVSRGHEVVAHSRTHAHLGDRNGIAIKYVGPQVAQASVSIGDGRLVTRIDGRTDLSLELGDPQYDTLLNLSLAIDKLKNYECRLENKSRVAKSFCLEDLSDQDCNRKAVQIKLDRDRFFDWEIAGSKQDIERNIGQGYQCKVASFPANSYDYQSKEACRIRGFLGARGGDRSQKNHSLEDLDVYEIWGTTPTELIGKTNIKRNTSALIEWMRYVGAIVFLYGHDHKGFPDEFSIPEWEDLLDVVQQSGITVMTLSEAIEHIRNIRAGFLPEGINADGEGVRWKRNLPETHDYHITGNSILIDKGKQLGLPYDYFGNIVFRGNMVDIGIHECQ